MTDQETVFGVTAENRIDGTRTFDGVVEKRKSKDECCTIATEKCKAPPEEMERGG
jgi:hypothetical protein